MADNTCCLENIDGDNHRPARCYMWAWITEECINFKEQRLCGLSGNEIGLTLDKPVTRVKFNKYSYRDTDCLKKNISLSRHKKLYNLYEVQNHPHMGYSPHSGTTSPPSYLGLRDEENKVQWLTSSLDTTSKSTTSAKSTKSWRRRGSDTNVQS